MEEQEEKQKKEILIGRGKMVSYDEKAVYINGKEANTEGKKRKTKLL